MTQDRVADLALAQGLVTPDQVREARRVAEQLAASGRPRRALGEVLVRLRALTPECYLVLRAAAAETIEPPDPRAAASAAAGEAAPPGLPRTWPIGRGDVARTARALPR